MTELLTRGKGSESGKTQLAVERAVLLDAKPTWNTAYTHAFSAAQTQFPNDAVAQLRFAERDADRVMRMNAARASSRHSQAILVDQAFLEVFGGLAGGAGARLVAIETFPDRIIARGVDGKLVKVPYAAGIDGVTFGTPQIVENLGEEQQH
jgi:hypothetical protein